MNLWEMPSLFLLRLRNRSYKIADKLVKSLVREVDVDGLSPRLPVLGSISAEEERAV